MDYGLIGGLAQGLQAGVQSYQSQKKDNEEQALKKRQMQLQEIGAYGKLKDELGEVPPELQKAFSPDVVQPMEGGNTGLLPGAQDSSGLLNPSPSSESPQDWQKTINPMSRRGREINKELAGLNAASFDKGHQFQFDPKKGYYSVPAELSPIAKANQAHQQLENDKLKKDLERSTPEEYNSAMYGHRAMDADQIIKDLRDQGYDRTAPLEALQSTALFPEAFKGENLKKQEQAERNFVNAILRPESGAAISESEFQNARQQYFPKVGDTPAVIAQKEQNRAREIQAIRAKAGRAWDKTDQPGSTAVASKPSGLLNSAKAAGGNQIPVLTPAQLNQMSDAELRQYHKKVTGK